MSKKCNNQLLTFYNETFNELYKIDTLVQLTRTNCENIEFSGQYYGVPREIAAHLSAERNNYINVLSILSERIAEIINKSILIEDEILSIAEHQRLQLTDNSSKFRI